MGGRIATGKHNMKTATETAQIDPKATCNYKDIGGEKLQSSHCGIFIWCAKNRVRGNLEKSCPARGRRVYVQQTEGFFYHMEASLMAEAAGGAKFRLVFK